MLNFLGVAYAPWVTQQIDEDAIVEDAFRKEKEALLNGGKKKTTTIDRGEIEFSEGMKWRMAGDQVDLAWITGTESNNKGTTTNIFTYSLQHIYSKYLIIYFYTYN